MVVTLDKLTFTLKNLKIYLSFIFVFFSLLLVLSIADTELNQNIEIIAVVQTLDNLTLSNMISQGSPYYGNLSATLVVVDFSDFQCHLCKKYVG